MYFEHHYLPPHLQCLAFSDTLFPNLSFSLRPVDSSLCHSYSHKGGPTYWSMVNLWGATPLKSSHKLSKKILCAARREVSFHAGMLIGLTLCISCAGRHSRYRLWVRKSTMSRRHCVTPVLPDLWLWVFLSPLPPCSLSLERRKDHSANFVSTKFVNYKLYLARTFYKRSISVEPDIPNGWGKEF